MSTRLESRKIYRSVTLRLTRLCGELFSGLFNKVTFLRGITTAEQLVLVPKSFGCTPPLSLLYPLLLPQLLVLLEELMGRVSVPATLTGVVCESYQSFSGIIFDGESLNLTTPPLLIAWL